MADYVIGVDGGNSKTDVIVATRSGRLLARSRGPGLDSPLKDVARWRADLIGAVEDAVGQAGLSGRRAAGAAYFLANVDLPVERRAAHRQLSSAALADVTVVHNDTLAVLRAGAQRSWGVAVASGAGINAIGVHPSGRVARFLALGDITGDLGGGHDLGVKALGAAVRATDGRGGATTLTDAVPRHFGLRRPEDVAIAVHRAEIPYDDLHALSPVVFAAANSGDPVARQLLDEFGTEVSTMVNALIRRLRLARTDVEVILGGGVLQTGDPVLRHHITVGITSAVPDARISVLDVPPVFGAAVEALRQLDGEAGAATRSLSRLRAKLQDS